MHNTEIQQNHGGSSILPQEEQQAQSSGDVHGNQNGGSSHENDQQMGSQVHQNMRIVTYHNTNTKKKKHKNYEDDLNNMPKPSYSVVVSARNAHQRSSESLALGNQNSQENGSGFVIDRESMHFRKIPDKAIDTHSVKEKPTTNNAPPPDIMIGNLVKKPKAQQSQMFGGVNRGPQRGPVMIPGARTSGQHPGLSGRMIARQIDETINEDLNDDEFDYNDHHNDQDQINEENFSVGLGVIGSMNQRDQVQRRVIGRGGPGNNMSQRPQ